MSMKSPEERARFRSLRDITGQQTLPQVFVEGRFVGGINEACRAVEDMAAGEANRHAQQGRMTSTAAWLGYGGLVPFAAGAAGSWWAPVADAAQRGLLFYAAVIITFVGAVHWGLGMARVPSRQGEEALVFSVLPALFAWLAVWLLPTAAALGVIMLGLVAVRGYELLRREQWFPQWYRRLRNHLSLGAALALLAGALAG
ncbi:DUF3429 family protein [Ectothiorhodospiraceae bacterium WFHF3C12]|nr:DUF3429 family protein [Ectothiorhodospiraceae bacterium WFHF3C12]